MRKILIACACLSLIGAQCADAAPGDYLKLSAGGLMSSGLEIFIDLDTAIATKRTTPRGSLAPGEQAAWRETKRQLTPGELQSLKETIISSLSEGLRSRACYDEDEASKKKAVGCLRASRQ